jgi:DNA processing protein
MVIASGLALGIDTLAHKITLKRGGKTVAVLGGGIDQRTIYPHTNYSLAKEIVARGGALISEYPPLFTPTKYTFPARNRIIAGLARGVLIIEAPEKSGALITAYSALDEGRDVYAVPGDITRAESAGANALIRRGAKPVARAEDILEEYGFRTESKSPKAMTALDKTEQSIVSLLGYDPRHIDEVQRAGKLPISTVSGVLAILEIKGVVRNVGGMRFIKL